MKQDEERLSIINNEPVAINLKTGQTRKIENEDKTNNEQGTTNCTRSGESAQWTDIKDGRGEDAHSRESVIIADTTSEIRKMESELVELTKREEELKQRVKELLKTKKKTFQSQLRKKERIKKLEKLVKSLEEAPNIQEDSDGDEQMTDLIYQFDKTTQTSTTVIDKFILSNEDDGTTVSITTSTTIRSNKSEEERKRRPIMII